MFVRVRLSDHDKIGVAGVAGQNDRQPVEPTGLKARFKNDAAAVRGLAGRCEDRLGFGFGVAQMFAGDFVRQVVTYRPAHEGFGHEIQRGDMGAEMLDQRQGRIEPFLCRRGLVEMNQKILDPSVTPLFKMRFR